MSSLISTVAISAMTLSVANVFLNLYLLHSVFWLKKVQSKAGLALIYCKFVVDMLHSADTSVYVGYFIVRLVDPTIVIKNFSFFIALPSFNLGTIRCWLTFLIALDRALATCIPISYHNHRSKVPLFGLILFIFLYSVFENYILFVPCGYVLDVPLNCTVFRCAVGTCYYNYWKWFQQSMYSLIGVLSIILFFRLFIWNACSKTLSNRTISRATRISLVDTIIIFAFDVFPVFLTNQWPQINTNTVGPFGSMCKMLGFVIESLIICHVLFGSKKVAPGSTSKSIPSNVPVVVSLPAVSSIPVIM